MILIASLLVATLVVARIAPVLAQETLFNVSQCTQWDDTPASCIVAIPEETWRCRACVGPGISTCLAVSCNTTLPIPSCPDHTHRIPPFDEGTETCRTPEPPNNPNDDSAAVWARRLMFIPGTWTTGGILVAVAFVLHAKWIIRVVLGALGFGIIVIGILALAWYGHITPSTTVVLLSWSGLLGSLLGAFAYCGLLCCGTRIRRACEVCTSGIHRWCLQAAESRARRRQVNAEMGAQLFHPSGV